MKLLITTQAVDLDDPVLGFFHRWLEEFARHCEKVNVVCLKEGRHSLPENVAVHSLGKEKRYSRLKYVFNFYRSIWRLRHEYDAVFAHMNPEYVVLGGLLWRLSRKKIVLWYTHRQVSLWQRIALVFSNTVATAAPESFRIRSGKVRVVGHGIDVERFARAPLKAIDARAPKLVAVGRITPIKNLDVALEALALLRREGIAATLDLVGSPVSTSDKEYEERLRAKARELHVDESVAFAGSVANGEMHEVYPRYDIALNLCPTGGIDKAVLESMAAGVPTVVANTAFRPYFGAYAERLLCAHGSAKSTAQKVRALLGSEDVPRLQASLRASARERAGVSSVVSAIMKLLYDAPGR